MKNMVNKIVPKYSDLQQDFSAKIELLVQNITQNENLQLIEVLAIITELRMCMAANEEPPVQELIAQTNLLKFILKCLEIKTTGELETCIKLEATWILINLSFSDDIDVISSLFDQEQDPMLIDLVDKGLQSG